MSYVPVFETVKSPSTFVSEEELVLLVLCNTCTFFDEPPPPLYVPNTLATQSSSVESPIFTVTPLLMFSADKFEVVTAFMVCAPVRYLLAAMLWSVVDGCIVCAAWVVTDAVSDTLELPAVPLDT